MTKTAALTNAYEVASAAFSAIAKTHAEVTKAYRARQIGDAEFLASRAAMNAAHAAFDAAELALASAEPEAAPVETSPQINLF